MDNKVSPPPNDSMYDNINQYVISKINPIVLIIIGLVVVAYIVVFMYLGKTSTSSDESSSSLVSSFTNSTPVSSESSFSTTIFIVVILLICFVLFFVKGWKYMYGYDISASLKNIFTSTPEVDVYVNKEPSPTPSPPVASPPSSDETQVFNIPGNYYNYADAKSLCSAYDARLATYSEMEQAYNKGAEWCNYGWSEDQIALFPTQKKTYDTLQTIPGHEHDCGRPGVNGGYIANPAIKFGVNCYGKKPPMTKEEQELMETTSPYPVTEKDIWMDKRVDYWKERLNDILVSPFNYNSWNKV